MRPHAAAVPRLLEALIGASGLDLSGAQFQLAEAAGIRPDTLRRQWARWATGTVLPRSAQLAALVEAGQGLGWLSPAGSTAKAEHGVAMLLDAVTGRRGPAAIERRATERAEPSAAALAAGLLALVQRVGDEDGLAAVFRHAGAQLRARSDQALARLVVRRLAGELRRAADKLENQIKA
jgi:hypothetical protein